jgi:aminoglycoside phosphotransferase (APT) family kinase protein
MLARWACEQWGSISAPAMMPVSALSEPGWEEFARSEVKAVLGAASTVVRVDPLRIRPEQVILLVTLARPWHQVVLKMAGHGAGTGTDFERTAAVAALARTAGAPVAAMLAVDVSYRAGPWRYLMQEHVDGVEWRHIRPQLDDKQVAAAHRQIAEAVLAVQSVRFGSYGELSASGEPTGADLLNALRHRADQRIVDVGRRELFLGLLERDADLFTSSAAPTLCHDDLHHANVIFRADHRGYHLAGLLDWDKAWAGPAESDIARMAFWDDMTGPGFWEVYSARVTAEEGQAERALVYQLLWCLEYDDDTPRHRADTAKLCRRLGVNLDIGGP